MKVSTSKKTLTGVAGAAAVLAAVAVTVAHGGSDRSPAPAATASANVPIASTSSGLVVAKDPATGALRAPTAEEMLQLQAQNPSPKKSKGTEPIVQRLPNGAYVHTLDSSTEMFSVAIKQPDGKIVTMCVPGSQVQATLDAAQQQTQTQTTTQVLDEK